MTESPYLSEYQAGFVHRPWGAMEKAIQAMRDARTVAELDAVMRQYVLLNDEWADERQDVLDRFTAELSKATGDGSKKRQVGAKPPWYRDDSHERAIFSHLAKWKRGELVDTDSGAHPLVHLAWRALAIACRESGNVPDAKS